MEIRPLRQTDSRLAVSRVYEESWRWAYRGLIPQSYLDSIPAGRWVPSLDRPGLETLLLLDGGEPAGVASVCASRWPDWPGYGEIVSLYLLPDRTGQGFGKLLLNAALQALAKRGYRDILLWVLEENHRARAFYERTGFTPGDARMTTDFDGVPLQEVLYLYQTT